VSFFVTAQHGSGSSNRASKPDTVSSTSDLAQFHEEDSSSITTLPHTKPGGMTFVLTDEEAKGHLGWQSVGAALWLFASPNQPPLRAWVEAQQPRTRRSYIRTSPDNPAIIGKLDIYTRLPKPQEASAANQPALSLPSDQQAPPKSWPFVSALDDSTIMNLRVSKRLSCLSRSGCLASFCDLILVEEEPSSQPQSIHFARGSQLTFSLVQSDMSTVVHL
jgi:hypothetical protein